MFIVLYY